jgi:hypothetical protein
MKSIWYCLWILAARFAALQQEGYALRCAKQRFLQRHAYKRKQCRPILNLPAKRDKVDEKKRVAKIPGLGKLKTRRLLARAATRPPSATPRV